MSYHVKREHLIGDRVVPYELPCSAPDKASDGYVIVRTVSPCWVVSVMRVKADQVYFKLEAV